MTCFILNPIIVFALFRAPLSKSIPAFTVFLEVSSFFYNSDHQHK